MPPQHHALSQCGFARWRVYGHPLVVKFRSAGLFFFVGIGYFWTLYAFLFRAFQCTGIVHHSANTGRFSGNCWFQYHFWLPPKFRHENQRHTHCHYGFDKAQKMLTTRDISSTAPRASYSGWLTASLGHPLVRLPLSHVCLTQIPWVSLLTCNFSLKDDLVTCCIIVFDFRKLVLNLHGLYILILYYCS